MGSLIPSAKRRTTPCLLPSRLPGFAPVLEYSLRGLRAGAFLFEAI